VIDGLGWAVVAATIAATALLLYYARVKLPAQYDQRLRDSVRVFATAVELRFPLHEGSSERVVELCMRAGRYLNLRPHRLRDLEMMARLSDIGLCAIPYRLVNGKEPSAWTQAERETYFRHPDISGAMLELIPSLQRLAEPIRQHHMPLTPDDIDLPLETRILNAVSRYCWLEVENGVEGYEESLECLKEQGVCAVALDALQRVLHSSRARDRQPSVPV
jgi:response regulator RpfG family c-di-GMP phosphodiesterase